MVFPEPASSFQVVCSNNVIVFSGALSCIRSVLRGTLSAEESIVNSCAFSTTTQSILKTKKYR